MRKIVLLIILFAAIITASTYYWHKSRVFRTSTTGPSLTVEFLNYNLGNGILAISPEGKAVLFDPGHKYASKNLVDYLKKRGIRSLTLIITYPSLEHVGAVPSLIDAFQIESFIAGEQESRYRFWKRIINSVGQQNVKVISLWAGRNLQLSKTVYLEILSPPKGLISAGNNNNEANSLVTRLRYKNIRILLASHSRIETEGYLIESGIDLNSNVLAVARHGKTGSTSLEFLSEVRPQYCVLQAGRESPHKTVLSRLDTSNTGATIFIADKSKGLVRLTTNGTQIKLENQPVK